MLTRVPGQYRPEASKKNSAGPVGWDRVVGVPGDMRFPHLGMQKETWMELIQSIDSVLLGSILLNKKLCCCCPT